MLLGVTKMNKKGIAIFVGLFIDIVAVIISFVLKNNFPKLEEEFIIVEVGMISAAIALIYLLFMDSILQRFVSFYCKNETEPSVAYQLLSYGTAYFFYIFPLWSLIILIVCVFK